MRIVLVRHGETEWSALRASTRRRTDIPLTERGREAAARAARAARRAASSRSCSPPPAPGRARRRGWPASSPEIDPDLAEVDYGDYEGRTTPEIREQRPGWTLWADGSPGGETLAAGGRARRPRDRPRAGRRRRRRALRPRPHPARARRALDRAAARARRQLRARHRGGLRARLRARDPRDRRLEHRPRRTLPRDGAGSGAVGRDRRDAGGGDGARRDLPGQRLRRRRRPARVGRRSAPPTPPSTSRPGCPFTAITASSASARAGFFEAAWWRFTAPPGTVVDRLRIARYGYRFLDVADLPQGGVNQGGWVSEAYTEDGPIIAGLAREGCTIARGQLPVRLGLQGPGRGGRVRPRRLADHLPGGVHPRQRLPQRQRHRVPARRRDDLQRRRDDPRRRQRRRCSSTARCSRAAGGGPATSWSSTAADASGISARHGHARAARFPTPCSYTRPAPCANVSAARLPLSGLADGAQTVSVTVKDAARQPRDLDAHGQRRRHAALGAAAAAVGAHADRRGRRRRLGRRGGQISVGGTPLPTTLARGRLTARLPSGNPRARRPPRHRHRQRRQQRHRRAAADRGRRARPGAQRPRRHAARAPDHAPRARRWPASRCRAPSTIRRRGATAQPAAGATTDARGRFTLRLPAGPSRNVRLLVPASGELLPAARDVAVRVPASSTIRASRRVVGAGTRVTFSGRIRRAGQPLAAARARRRPAGPDRRRLADVRRHPDHARRALEGELPLPRPAGDVPRPAADPARQHVPVRARLLADDDRARPLNQTSQNRSASVALVGRNVPWEGFK